VTDIESHEAYKRGRAVDREDKREISGPAIHKVVEESEEVSEPFEQCYT
jgi:hypothetical protein